jgi:hypothetical protein
MSVGPESAKLASSSGADTGLFHGAVTNIVHSAPEEPDELKQKLLELAIELDRIKDFMPADAIATLKTDVENLSREAMREKHPEKLRTSGENITSALK